MFVVLESGDWRESGRNADENFNPEIGIVPRFRNHPPGIIGFHPQLALLSVGGVGIGRWVRIRAEISIQTLDLHPDSGIIRPESGIIRLCSRVQRAWIARILPES